MRVAKGELEVTISLNKSNCYFMKTGTCSLNIVHDYYVGKALRNAPDDLLYCPRLYRAMRHREREKPVLAVPCTCGHVEAVSAPQRACIASRKGIELVMQDAGKPERDTCAVCGGQITFDKNAGGDRIVTVRAVVRQEKI